MTRLLKYARTDITELHTKCPELIAEHRASVPVAPGCTSDVNMDTYHAMDRAEAIRTYKLEADGVIVGYACFVIAESHHSRGSVMALQDAIYVRPEFRGRSIDFMRYCDKQLSDEGVDVVTKTVSHGGRNFGPVLERMGYEKLETVYVKNIRNR